MPDLRSWAGFCLYEMTFTVPFTQHVIPVAMEVQALHKRLVTSAALHCTIEQPFVEGNGMPGSAADAKH